MKVSLNWIKQYTDVTLPIDELVTRIGAQLGAVEEVIDFGKIYQDVVIALVKKCQKHPDADKLSVCLLDDGGKTKGVKRDKNGLVQVVCGAPNVREGLVVAWLPPGATVPASVGKEPFVLEAREIRGVVSNGMIASASELAISDDHSGILEITEDVKPGDDFAEVFDLNDYVIDIENKMFTHRPDCFGQLGVAREIAGIQQMKFQSPEIYLRARKQETGNRKQGLQLRVENKAGEVVPRFIAQVFENVKVQSSPVWLQAYLMRVGVRPINNIVDITNYFMMLTGQPLHAYDYDKLLKVSGLKTASLESRLSKKGDKLKLLNGKELVFEDNSTILITSNDVPVGIAGVMGGSETEVDETTKNIVLECANFDMYSIRKTSMKYGLFTDAVTRFNKGQSALQNDRVVAWAAEEIKATAGCQPGNMVDTADDLPAPKMIRLGVSFTNQRLGLELDADTMQKLLTNVEFTVERPDNADELQVTPPFWRTDIEIPEDLVEEIGRLYGYDKLPLELPARTIAPTQRDNMLDLKQKIRAILAKAGANEVLSYSFVHGDLITKAGQDSAQAYKLSNAISPDLQYYRLSLTPSLLDKVHMNVKAGYNEFALFEIGKTHSKQHVENKLPKELEKIALVVADSEPSSQAQGAQYFTAKKYLDQLSSTLGIDITYQPLAKEPDYQTAKPFDFKRSAEVIDTQSGLVIGVVGEFKQSVSRSFKLPTRCAGFELSTAKLLKLSTTETKYRALPRFPKVQQDISLKVPEKIAYQQVYNILAAELLDQPNTRADLQPLDIYQRENDPAHVQMSFRLTIASFEKTLKNEEVNTLLDNAAKIAKEKLHTERI